MPVARNQAHIIKNFCQLSRQGFCKIVLGEDKDMAAQRMALLEQVTKREIEGNKKWPEFDHMKTAMIKFIALEIRV